jgi:hypothetical protein
MHALAVCLLANRIRCHACYSPPGSLVGPYACSVARSIQYFSAVTTAAAPDSAGPVIAFSRRHRRALCLVVRECCHIHWFASLPYCTGLTLVWSCLVCCGNWQGRYFGSSTFDLLLNFDLDLRFLSHAYRLVWLRLKFWRTWPILWLGDKVLRNKRNSAEFRRRW